MDSASQFESAYKNLHSWAFPIGSCFAIVAVILSLYLVFQHLKSYTVSEEQKWIVGVIFMVPVYSTDSVISLWNPRYSLVFDTLRDLYEAFALYSFGSYLVACLGGERRVNEILENKSRKSLGAPLLEEKRKENNVRSQARSFRNFFLQPCVIGRDLFTIEKFGLVQYMILKTLCAMLAFILEIFGVYGNGEFKLYYGYPYITLVLNFSQIWALYCLVQFYNVIHNKLSDIKPLAKFISFKAIVFATWWQGVGIALACYLRILPKDQKFETILQEFLVCIEMSIAAVAHMFVFSADAYRRTQKVETITTKVQGEEATLQNRETKVETEGTSIRESVEDIVVQGGQCVMKDVILTINQAMGPVEKGVTRIQETLLRKPDEETVDVKVEKRVEPL